MKKTILLSILITALPMAVQADNAVDECARKVREVANYRNRNSLSEGKKN